jgi:hypothetical protein
MGYNVSITGADFTITEDKLPAAFEAMKALNKRDELKTGGAWGQLPDGSYGQTEVWFAWMPANYDETCKDAAAIFEELGFDVEDDSVDGVQVLRLTGYDSKTGAENVFLEAVAPFVTPGSYLEWEGEDGDRWRNEFNAEGTRTRTGYTAWEE